MRISFRGRHHDEIEFGLIYGGIAVLAMVALRFMPVVRLLPDCVFRGLTALPCPACGATRSAFFLSHGKWFASLSMNPLAALAFASICIYFVYSLFAYLLHFPRTMVVFSPPERLRVRTAIALLVLVNWAYLIFTLPSSS